MGNPPSNWAAITIAIIGAIAVVLAALLAYEGGQRRATTIAIEATMTAEARLVSPTSIEVAQLPTAISPTETSILITNTPVPPTATDIPPTNTAMPTSPVSNNTAPILTATNVPIPTATDTPQSVATPIVACFGKPLPHRPPVVGQPWVLPEGGWIIVNFWSNEPGVDQTEHKLLLSPDDPRAFLGGGSAWQWVEACEGDARHNLQTNPLLEISLEELRTQNLVQ